MVVSHDVTPAPNRYNVQSDNINFKRKNGVRLNTTERRFFELKDVSLLKSSLPTQYTGLDGVSPKADDFSFPNSRGTRLSMYFGGGSTSRYR